MEQIVVGSFSRLEQSVRAGEDKAASLIKYELGFPLELTETQMAECLKFDARKAVIISQADYTLLRVILPSFGNLAPTANDARHARHMAHGLGILDGDITSLVDADVAELNRVFNAIRREYRDLSRQGLQSFLYVYCAAHGVADQQQYLVLNCTSGNIFNI